MSIELQCDISVFRQLVERRIRRVLYSHEFDTWAVLTPLGPKLFYVDHADMNRDGVQDPTAVTEALGPDIFGALDFDARVTLAFAERADVLSAPMAVPLVLTQQVTLTLRMQIERRSVERIAGVKTRRPMLTVRGVAADFGPYIEGMITKQDDRDALHNSVLAFAGGLIDIDLLDLYEGLGLGLYPPGSVVLGLTDKSQDLALAVRFDPQGDTVRRLLPGQNWGLWLHAEAVCDLVKTEVAKAFPPSSSTRLTGSEERWNPRGSTAAVDSDLHAEIVLPEPFAEVPAELSLTCMFGVPSPGSLRIDVHWSFDGFGVLGGVIWATVPWLVPLMEAEARARIRAELRKPAPGRTVLGDDRFTIERPLPAPRFFGAPLSITSAGVAGQGMTLGGLLTLPFDIGDARLSVSISEPWSPYSFVVVGCPATPPRLGGPVTPDLARTSSVVVFRHTGTELDAVPRLQAIEYISPGEWLDTYVAHEGTALRFELVATVAATVLEPIRLIVRTPRGVRLVELPAPPTFELDANGRVVGSSSAFIDWCPTIDRRDPWRLLIGRVLVSPGGLGDTGGAIGGQDDGPSWALPGPVRQPPGSAWPGATGGPASLVQVLSFDGLQPGELLQFASADHNVIVAADAQGQAWLPVLLADPTRHGGEVRRVNGQALDQHWTTRSATLIRAGHAPAGELASLQGGPEGASISLRHGQETLRFAVGAWGGAVALRASPSQLAVGIAADEPEPPTAPLVSNDHVLLPGLADAQLALRPQPDGPAQVLRLMPNAEPRVVGLFDGPLPAWEEADGWGVALGTRKHGVYRVETSAPERSHGRCGCEG